MYYKHCGLAHVLLQRQRLRDHDHHASYSDSSWDNRKHHPAILTLKQINEVNLASSRLSDQRPHTPNSPNQWFMECSLIITNGLICIENKWPYWHTICPVLHLHLSRNINNLKKPRVSWECAWVSHVITLKMSQKYVSHMKYVKCFMRIFFLFACHPGGFNIWPNRCALVSPAISSSLATLSWICAKSPCVL